MHLILLDRYNCISDVCSSCTHTFSSSCRGSPRCRRQEGGEPPLHVCYSPKFRRPSFAQAVVPPTTGVATPLSALRCDGDLTRCDETRLWVCASVSSSL